MTPDDFFKEEQDHPTWELNGRHSRPRSVFKSDFVARLRQGPQERVRDFDAAYGLTRLAHRELEAYGTDGAQKLDNEQINDLMRSLKAVLQRLGIAFVVPFQDFKSFHGYWSSKGMAESWAKRRGYLSELFSPVLSRLDETEAAERCAIAYRGVDGEMKNIIFGSTGAKPEIVLRDAINNVIEVVRYSEFSLIYNRPLTEAGLTWGELVSWWKTEKRLEDKTDRAVAEHLYERLVKSLGSEVERILFDTYCERYAGDEANRKPALLPQVYLHYDPLTVKERRALGKPDRLGSERMDFLLLLPNSIRIVIEVDGKQHYAEGDVASPRLYSKMMAEDRALRLKGYDVYRFGGSEMGTAEAPVMLRKFFDDLEARYDVRR